MQELAPSSVPVPLTALTEDGTLGLRQIAGPVGSGRLVHSVHTSEMADPRPYLLGGELLLSAGVHCPGTAEGTEGPHVGSPGGAQEEAARAYWQEYAERAVGAGAAVLGFGVAPVHDTVPPALTDACHRLGLPLVEVPRRTTFAAVARAVWQAMAERRHRELRRLSEAQQTLAAAAARPHPVPAVLRQLAHHLDAWTVLFGAGGEVLASAGTAPEQPVRTELASLAARLHSGPSSAAGTLDGQQLSVFGLGRRDGPALGVCAAHRDGTDGAVARVAVVLLSLLTGSRTAVTDFHRSAALVRLMLGGDPADAAPLLGDVRQWLVVHGKYRPQSSGRAGQDLPWPDGDTFALSALAAGLGTQLVDVQGDTLRALVPAGALIEPQPGWTLGAGPPVDVAGLARSDAEAALALRRALVERRAFVRYGDGGGTGGTGAAGVASLVPAGERQAHARTLLAGLDGKPALAGTVRMWLALHGSWDRTAVALSVHRNTVRQRIARAEELLGLDLSDPDVRMEVWFALKWR